MPKGTMGPSGRLSTTSMVHPTGDPRATRKVITTPMRRATLDGARMHRGSLPLGSLPIKGGPTVGFYEVRGNTSMRPSANEAEVRGSSPMGSMRAGVAVSPKKARRVVSGMSLSAAPVNMVNPFAATAGQTQTLSNSQ